MVGVILKATNSYFQKGMTFCRCIYVKKVMKLLAFIFEQPSYFIKCKENARIDAVLMVKDIIVIYRNNETILI